MNSIFLHLFSKHNKMDTDLDLEVTRASPRDYYEGILQVIYDTF